MAYLYARSEKILVDIIAAFKIKPYIACTFDAFTPISSMYSDLIPKLPSTTLDSFLLFNSVNSTQDFLLQKPLNYSVIAAAHTQTKGVGRKGNAWESPHGSMCFSHNLTLDRAQLMLAQYMCSYCMYQALQPIEGLFLKWPNDIYYYNTKLCGVLCNLVRVKGNKASIICGLGLNYNNIYKGVHLAKIKENTRAGDIIVNYLKHLKTCVADENFHLCYSNAIMKYNAK
jgi:biotin-[acetyl-CoA-carboxylase] ligase BirA-like protein